MLEFWLNPFQSDDFSLIDILQYQKTMYATLDDSDKSLLLYDLIIDANEIIFQSGPYIRQSLIQVVAKRDNRNPNKCYCHEDLNILNNIRTNIIYLPFLRQNYKTKYRGVNSNGTGGYIARYGQRYLQTFKIEEEAHWHHCWYSRLQYYEYKVNKKLLHS